MHRSDYIFGDIGLCIESEEYIADTLFFRQFRVSARSEPVITVRVVRSELPMCGNRPPEIGHHFRTVHQGDCLSYTCFSDTLNPDKTPYACEIRHGNDIELYIDYSGPVWDSMLFDALSFPDIMLEYDRAILHSSFISADGRGILFAGEKGQGKSTQAELWQKHCNAIIINGDRALIKTDEPSLTAYGIPFCGSSRICLNEQRTVRAVFFPEKWIENRVSRLNGFDAFKRLIGCISYTTDDVQAKENAISAAERIAFTTPCYRLVCTPDERAVKAALDVL